MQGGGPLWLSKVARTLALLCRQHSYLSGKQKMGEFTCPEVQVSVNLRGVLNVCACVPGAVASLASLEVLLA